METIACIWVRDLISRAPSAFFLMLPETRRQMHPALPRLFFCAHDVPSTSAPEENGYSPIILLTGGRSRSLIQGTIAVQVIRTVWGPLPS